MSKGIPTLTIHALAEMYSDKMGDALEEVGEILNQAETPQEWAMLNAMFSTIINFNDMAVAQIFEAAKRLESGNV